MTSRQLLCGWVVALVIGTTLPAQARFIRWVDDDQADGFDCDVAPYSTITEALEHAFPGDEIRVCPGIYAEQIVATSTLTIRGEIRGARRAIIKPTALPATLPSLEGGNPVAAAILSDGHLVRFSDVDIDLSDVVTSACSPMVAGIYVRNGILMMERSEVANVRVSDRPDCESGVGVLVESGPESIVLGTPIY